MMMCARTALGIRSLRINPTVYLLFAIPDGAGKKTYSSQYTAELNRGQIIQLGWCPQGVAY